MRAHINQFWESRRTLCIYMRWKTEQKSLRLDTPFLVRRESERRGPSVGGLDAMSQCNCFKIVKEGSNVIIVCQFCIPNVSLSLSPLCGWGALFPARMSMFLVILRFLFFNSFPPSGAWAISLSGSGCDCRLRLHGCCADPIRSDPSHRAVKGHISLSRTFHFARPWQNP